MYKYMIPLKKHNNLEYISLCCIYASLVLSVFEFFDHHSIHAHVVYYSHILQITCIYKYLVTVSFDDIVSSSCGCLS